MNLFTCKAPLMLDLPMTLGETRYKNRDGDIIKLKPKQARRNSFMLCSLHQNLNAALIHYKRIMCSNNDTNYNKTINAVKFKNY